MVPLDKISKYPFFLTLNLALHLNFAMEVRAKTRNLRSIKKTIKQGLSLIPQTVRSSGKIL